MLPASNNRSPASIIVEFSASASFPLYLYILPHDFTSITPNLSSSFPLLLPSNLPFFLVMPTSSRGKQLGKISEKSASFHGRNPAIQPILRRPKTDPDLLSGRKVYVPQSEMSPKLTKLLINVTIERSLGAIHMVISPESTVGDFVAAAVRQYVKEGIRPLLQTTDPSRFDLHYSTFSLESLDRKERLMNLGSRNFFMCRSNKAAADHVGVAKTATCSSSASSCSNEADKASQATLPWQKIMELFI